MATGLLQRTWNRSFAASTDTRLFFRNGLAKAFFFLLILSPFASLFTRLSCKYKHTTGNKLLIGYASGYSFEVVHSLSSAFHLVTDSTASIVLFSELRGRERRQLEQKFHRLRLVDPRSLDHVVDMSWGQGVLSKPAFFRYFVTHNWLLPRYDDYEYIIVSDTRDIAIFGDPFVQFYGMGNHVLTFTERNKYIDDPRWNQRWVRNCYGEPFLKGIMQEQITCCGLVGGTSHAMKTYLHHFLQELLKKQGCDEQGIDTAVHVWIVHKHPDIVKVIDAEAALIRHCPASIVKDSRGRVLNKLGQPYALIHQADRVPDIWEPYYRQHAKNFDDNLTLDS
tara:strand:+ start:298 stop:1305 length:1008 start_codon:yes stop_codon:yes gene_type:complete